MNNLEDLFKKVNKDNIRLDAHKEKLRAILLEDGYFKDGRESWDWKLSLSSVAFSAILIIFAVNFSGGGNANLSQGSTPTSNNETFYDKLERSKNVSPAASGANALEMIVEDDVKTVFYFNERNVLIHSEVLNNK